MAAVDFSRKLRLPSSRALQIGGPILSWSSVAVVVPGLIALGIMWYQLSLPNVLFGLHGYDDGAYFGSAIRLVHGVMPYRDFVFVHPPGITLLMSPVAALGRVIGTRDALAIGRCITGVVTALDASLAAMALRHRGRIAMMVSGTALATFPLAVAADHSVLLGPYLVFFCLLGVVATFSGGSLADRRRLFIGGLLFGIAGLVKVWAILPVIPILVVLAPGWRKDRASRFVLGLVLGFGIPVLPFFLAAPGAFINDVLVAQLSRGASSVAALSTMERLLMVTGLSGIDVIKATPEVATWVAGGLSVAIAGVYLAAARRLSRLEWFALLATAAVLVGTLRSVEYFDQYAYFSAPFMALLLGICASRVVDWFARARVGRHDRWTPIFKIGPVLAGTAALLSTALFIVPQDVSYAASYVSPATDPGGSIAATIPKGACVVFDEPTFAIIANRFDSFHPGCPAVVDTFASWLASDPAHPPPYSGPYPQAFVDTWRAWLGRADYLVQVAPRSDFIPWPADELAWFNANYKIVYFESGAYVYKHVNHATPGRTTTAASANQLVGDGLAAQLGGNLDEALKDYRAAEAADPTNKFAPYDIGVIDQQRNQIGAAADEYRKALAIDPEYPPALYNLAVLEAPTDPLSAISLYREELQVSPSDASANFNLGILLINQGQSATGRAYLGTALRLNPALASDLPPGIQP